MKTGAPRLFRRSILLAAVGILALVLAACTGVGGGQLPPSTGFTGPASFGFTFSCEDKGGLNPPAGKLSIELAYAERGTYSYVGGSVMGSSFSIHGIVDQIDPVLESMHCAGPNPPDVPGTLTFLGRYRLTSSAPAGFPPSCPTRETKTTPLCRFEVMVQDKDHSLTPSPGDFFSIKLSSATVLDCTNPLECSQLPDAKVFYARAGYLSSGNLTVK